MSTSEVYGMTRYVNGAWGRSDPEVPDGLDLWYVSHDPGDLALPASRFVVGKDVDKCVAALRKRYETDAPKAAERLAELGFARFATGGPADYGGGLRSPAGHVRYAVGSARPYLVTTLGHTDEHVTRVLEAAKEFGPVVLERPHVRYGQLEREDWADHLRGLLSAQNRQTVPLRVRVAGSGKLSTAEYDPGEPVRRRKAAEAAAKAYKTKAARERARQEAAARRVNLHHCARNVLNAVLKAFTELPGNEWLDPAPRAAQWAGLACVLDARAFWVRHKLGTVSQWRALPETVKLAEAAEDAAAWPEKPTEGLTAVRPALEKELKAVRALAGRAAAESAKTAAPSPAQKPKRRPAV